MKTMKKNLILIIALLTILQSFAYASDKEITCVIKGKTVGRVIIFL